MSAPLVMVHGSFGHGGDWSDIASHLGRTATCPDLPGHGARPGEAAVSFDATAEELVAALPSGCDLVGYSLGGRLALAAAVRAPRGRVRSLVLESAHPGLDGAARARRLDEDRARAVELERDPEGFLRRFYEAPLFDSFRRHPRFEAVLAERIARARRAPAALAETFVALSPGNQPALAGALLDAGVPTLVVVGGLDAKYAQLGRGLVASAPAGAPVRLVDVEGAGHNVHLEEPDAFAAALRTFWEECA